MICPQGFLRCSNNLYNLDRKCDDRGAQNFLAVSSIGKSSVSFGKKNNSRTRKWCNFLYFIIQLDHLALSIKITKGRGCLMLFAVKIKHFREIDFTKFCSDVQKYSMTAVPQIDNQILCIVLNSYDFSFDVPIDVN